MSQSAKQIQLVASGDLRLSANQKCWPAQLEMERSLGRAVEAAGFEVVRAHPYKDDVHHGFIASQREGIEVFRTVDVWDAFKSATTCAFFWFVSIVRARDSAICARRSAV